MDATRLQDVSLYEAALSSKVPPKPLKISPTTFKSMVESLFDVLMEHERSATLWTKLPREKVWQTPLKTYCQQVIRSEPLYVLKPRKEEDTEKEESLEDSPSTATTHVTTHSAFTSTMRTSMPSGFQTMDPNLKESFPTTELAIAPDSRLRREFFVLVITPGLQALVLAHRPRSARQSYSNSTTASDSSSALTSSSVVADDTPERKPALLGFCSFDPDTIQVVLSAIAQAVDIGYAQTPDEKKTVEPLLQSWSKMSNTLAEQPVDPYLMGSLWTRYIRYQEEMWRNGATARKQADKTSELQLKNEELLNSIRLKDEFFKTVGQELRTPLSTMKTALSLLTSPNLKANQRQRYMDLLTQECNHQSALITSVLELVQLDNVDELSTLQPIRLMDVIPGVVSTYQPLAQEKGIMLAYTIPENLPTVSCLNPWLRQIFINLLHNAIKFTPEGGNVWVRAKPQGDYIQIEVSDTGIGIATTDIPKIFNRFYRVRPSTGEDASGAGLGLSIVQQLLLRCGGSISVNSRLGEGSAFNVLLTVYQQDDDS